MPRVDLPELILEIASRTGFTDAFTHISERTARATDLYINLCAVLVAEACSTGLEPLVRADVSARKRDLYYCAFGPAMSYNQFVLGSA
jgi:hypothetical protein